MFLIKNQCLFLLIVIFPAPINNNYVKANGASNGYTKPTGQNRYFYLFDSSCLF